MTIIEFLTHLLVFIIICMRSLWINTFPRRSPVRPPEEKKEHCFKNRDSESLKITH